MVLIGCAIAVISPACGSSKTGGSSSSLSRSITVRCAESLRRPNPSAHAKSGSGHCAISGAINDRGTVTDSRTQKGNLATVRRVAVGSRGTITFVIKVNVLTGEETWTIASATKAYRGLHGTGRQVIDAYYKTPARFVMKGTVQPSP
jgi:hypothetical protein